MKLIYCHLHHPVCTIADYIDAVGQIEVNTLLLAFKTGGMECLTQFLQNKEIIILAYIL